MEADISPETLVPMYETTLRHIPEDCNLNIHRRGNLKPHYWFCLASELHRK
jgi:hypothetical protein